MAGFIFVQGAQRIVTSLTRSIRYIVPIDLVGDGSPVPAGMAGTKSVQGALRVVTTFAARVGSADGLFVQGAEVVVTTFAAR
jgi:hypothetical protein